MQGSSKYFLEPRQAQILAWVVDSSIEIFSTEEKYEPMVVINGC